MARGYVATRSSKNCSMLGGIDPPGGDETLVMKLAGGCHALNVYKKRADIAEAVAAHAGGQLRLAANHFGALDERERTLEPGDSPPRRRARASLYA